MNEDRSNMNLDEAPQPKGWRILVLPLTAEEVTAGGIVLGGAVQDANKHLTCVGEVLAMGDLCYRGDRFKLGEDQYSRWCEVGDKVVYSAYTGQKIRYLTDDGEIELLVINDDDVKGTTDSPARVRAYV